MVFAPGLPNRFHPLTPGCAVGWDGRPPASVRLPGRRSAAIRTGPAACCLGQERCDWPGTAPPVPGDLQTGATHRPARVAVGRAHPGGGRSAARQRLQATRCRCRRGRLGKPAVAGRTGSVPPAAAAHARRTACLRRRAALPSLAFPRSADWRCQARSARLLGLASHHGSGFRRNGRSPGSAHSGSPRLERH